MALEARLTKIPNFVTAQTAQGLRRAMMTNNVRNSMQFVYHSIQFVNGAWFAWYYLDANPSEVLGVSNGTAET